LKGSFENVVVVKSVVSEEGNELMDYANSQEDGKTTNSTTVAIYVSVEVDRYDSVSRPYLLDNKTTDMLVERGPAQISGDACDFPKTDNNQHFSVDFFSRTFPNLESVQRNWLVYYEKADVFCFCSNCTAEKLQSNQ
jgi:hypothetical protein